MLDTLIKRIKNRLAHERRASSNMRKFPIFINGETKIIGKVVVLNFSSRRLERHYYFIIKFLSLSGYTSVLLKNRGYFGSISSFEKELLNVKNVFVANENMPEADLYFYDSVMLKDKIKAKKKVFVRIDTFNYSKHLKDHLLMYLPMSVEQYDLLEGNSFKAQNKALNKMRILYSGNLYRDIYDSSSIKEIYGKLSRVQIIDFLKESLQADEIDIKNSIKDVASTAKRFVLYDWYWKPNDQNLNARIDNVNWLGFLGEADFFLSCPGIVMPPTHAVVEAMFVGAIPIIQYPEFYPDGLEDGKNCLIFCDKKDLLKKVRLALNMNEADISIMSGNIIEYYNNNLSPKSYIEKIEHNPSQQINYFMYTDYSHLSN